jgi:hypothetical protein
VSGTDQRCWMSHVLSSCRLEAKSKRLAQKYLRAKGEVSSLTVEHSATTDRFEEAEISARRMRDRAEIMQQEHGAMKERLEREIAERAQESAAASKELKQLRGRLAESEEAVQKATEQLRKRVEQMETETEVTRIDRRRLEQEKFDTEGQLRRALAEKEDAETRLERASQRLEEVSSDLEACKADEQEARGRMEQLEAALRSANVLVQEATDKGETGESQIVVERQRAVVAEERCDRLAKEMLERDMECRQWQDAAERLWKQFVAARQLFRQEARRANAMEVQSSGAKPLSTEDIRRREDEQLRDAVENVQEPFVGGDLDTVKEGSSFAETHRALLSEVQSLRTMLRLKQDDAKSDEEQLAHLEEELEAAKLAATVCKAASEQYWAHIEKLEAMLKAAKIDPPGRPDDLSSIATAMFEEAVNAPQEKQKKKKRATRTPGTELDFSLTRISTVRDESDEPSSARLSVRSSKSRPELLREQDSPGTKAKPRSPLSAAQRITENSGRQQSPEDVTGSQKKMTPLALVAPSSTSDSEAGNAVQVDDSASKDDGTSSINPFASARASVGQPVGASGSSDEREEVDDSASKADDSSSKDDGASSINPFASARASVGQPVGASGSSDEREEVDDSSSKDDGASSINPFASERGSVRRSFRTAMELSKSSDDDNGWAAGMSSSSSKGTLPKDTDELEASNLWGITAEEEEEEGGGGERRPRPIRASAPGSTNFDLSPSTVGSRRQLADPSWAKLSQDSPGHTPSNRPLEQA